MSDTRNLTDARWLTRNQQQVAQKTPRCDKCGSTNLILGERKGRCANCDARLVVFRF